MSAGAFTSSFYEADDGTIYPIRIQPETIIATTNPAATGPAAAKIRARVSGSRKGYGMHARTMRLRFTGTVPAGYAANSVVTLPVLTLAAYNALVPDQAVTYLGSAAKVIGKSPERSR